MAACTTAVTGSGVVRDEKQTALIATRAAPANMIELSDDEINHTIDEGEEDEDEDEDFKPAVAKGVLNHTGTSKLGHHLHNPLGHLEPDARLPRLESSAQIWQRTGDGAPFQRIKRDFKMKEIATSVSDRVAKK